jgi:hypothetical protein
MISIFANFTLKYRISSYSFRGNYSFLNLEIQRSQYIRPKVTVNKCAETIQGRKLFKGGNYMRKYGMYFVGSNFFTNATLTSCPFLSSKLDSPVIKTLRHTHSM